MNITSNFIRLVFTLLSTTLLTAYAITSLDGGANAQNILIGIISGIAFSAAIISLDSIFKKFSLRSLNIAALGLFAGYLLGNGFNAILNATIEPETLSLNASSLNLIRSVIYLVCGYVGLTLAMHSSEELYLSIPFVKFQAVKNKKKDILVDSSLLLDSRILDLASSGLLDNQLIFPRFLIKELYSQVESSDENAKAKARRSLDVAKRLETLPNLNMRFSETDFPEVKDSTAKLVRLARVTDSNIITADISRIQQSAIEGITVINIHSLSNALKPLTQSGELINIKIQRYGKEPRQGIGYLEDGTMVVVNGGAEHIGETIKAQVLSVKHTSAGRMIFCNSTEESMLSDQESDQNLSYFAVSMAHD